MSEVTIAERLANVEKQLTSFSTGFKILLAEMRIVMTLMSNNQLDFNGTAVIDKANQLLGQALVDLNGVEDLVRNLSGLESVDRARDAPKVKEEIDGNVASGGYEGDFRDVGSDNEVGPVSASVEATAAPDLAGRSEGGSGGGGMEAEQTGENSETPESTVLGSSITATECQDNGCTVTEEFVVKIENDGGAGATNSVTKADDDKDVHGDLEATPKLLAAVKVDPGSLELVEGHTLGAVKIDGVKGKRAVGRGVKRSPQTLISANLPKIKRTYRGGRTSSTVASRAGLTLPPEPAIKRMLELVRDRLTRLKCDKAMETTWSTMWSVTDESPKNCEEFLKSDGLVLFLNCLKAFPNKPGLLRNMMGLLGNVAEVGGLRKYLMTSELISVLCELLESTKNNFEVSYNAAGVLAHILSDGAGAWGIANPKRSLVQEFMVSNVNKWDINSFRKLNYTSFQPVLRLLKVTHTKECQLWACWALANLTRVNPDKYVPIVKKENGLPLLHELYEEPMPSSSSSSTQIHENLKNYAGMTLRNVEQFNMLG